MSSAARVNDNGYGAGDDGYGLAARPELSVRTRTADASTATGEHHGDARLVRCAIPIGPTAPAIARSALTKAADTLSSSLLSHAQLLVSDLVSHRVRVGPGDRRGLLDLEISLTQSYLRVQLADDDGRARRVVPEPGEPVLGWELAQVAELADRWGMRHDARTTLWFELDR